MFSQLSLPCLKKGRLFFRQNHFFLMFFHSRRKKGLLEKHGNTACGGVITRTDMRCMSHLFPIYTAIEGTFYDVKERLWNAIQLAGIGGSYDCRLEKNRDKT